MLPTSVKIFTKSTFREFQAPIWELSSRVEDLSNYWGHLTDSKQTLIEKGKKLSRLNADLSLQTVKILEFEKEINRLKNLKNSIQSLNDSINLDKARTFKSEIARVSIRKINSWWQKITIRKGFNYGIEKGQGVVYNGGIFGRVKEVDSRSSEIDLITNPSFRIVAHFEKDNRPVRFQGNGINTYGLPQGIVTDVPHDISPTDEKPLRLLTSSLGGNFPHGIVIGTVKRLEGGENGLFKTGVVYIDKEINKVYEVAVLVKSD